MGFIPSQLVLTLLGRFFLNYYFKSSNERVLIIGTPWVSFYLFSVIFFCFTIDGNHDRFDDHDSAISSLVYRIAFGINGHDRCLPATNRPLRYFFLGKDRFY